MGVFGTACALVNQADFKFISFAAKFNKAYTTLDEFNIRKELFLATDADIARINAAQTSSRHAHNIFSDLTASEFEKLLSFKSAPLPKPQTSPTFETKQSP